MLIIIEMFLRSATPHTMAEELSRVYFYIIAVSIYLLLFLWKYMYQTVVEED